jgi:5'-deoxynucleotidase YfbR-like HD superfamily hydrolase
VPRAHVAAAKAPRAWQRMLSGRKLDLLDPSPFDIEIGDIAHGLARVARWNGQTKGTHAFSVAQHCVIVEDLARNAAPKLDARARLMCLLHDAPEYVIGDMISPFKAALGLDYRAFEQRLANAIHLRFGLPAEPDAALKALIKRADIACAYFEAVQLAGFEEKEAQAFFGKPPKNVTLTLTPACAEDAQALFLERFEALMGEA